MLLDETWGFHPFTTWSTTTFDNAERLLNESGWGGRRTRLGVLRTFFTRHGPGPLMTEDPSLRALLPERHNVDSGWQGAFRTGLFDAVAARYAVAAAGGVNSLAITHVDRIAALPRQLCTGYRPPAGLTPATRDRWFEVEAGRIHAIRADRIDPDAEAAARTASVQACQPMYEPINGDSDDAFLWAIGHAVKAPVALTSHGPTALDKRLTDRGL